VALAAPAVAFRDDFGGDWLGDWWDFHSETGAKMDYYLADGWLHVTRVHGPVDGNSPSICTPGQKIGPAIFSSPLASRGMDGLPKRWVPAS
jgi:hypothetical protein